MQRFLFLYIGIDESLVRHQIRAGTADLKSSKRRFGSRVNLTRRVSPLAVAPPSPRGRGFWLFLDDMDIHFLQQRRVAVGQPDLEFVSVVGVFIGGPGRSIPGVVLRIADLPTVYESGSSAANAEIHL